VGLERVPEKGQVRLWAIFKEWQFEWEQYWKHDRIDWHWFWKHKKFTRNGIGNKINLTGISISIGNMTGFPRIGNTTSLIGNGTGNTPNSTGNSIGNTATVDWAQYWKHDRCDCQ
jgi:hypothetical protein